ncbi:M48 family metallopeptidase [Pseudoxanthomonas sp. CAU 1598]|uniref:M48 family metallopeptidase n=2 Tax=Pseudomarimonas arenosa TaxID=2774145 RepID=A0AAW3ZQ42_9GAMM|nr:M48 family metallopeptidase [Pseudomarimonas arenosa]
MLSPPTLARFALSLATLLLGACATTPSGRSQLLLVSDQQMNQMGLTAFEQMKANDKVSVVPAKSVYAKCVVDALVAELPTEWQRLPWEVQAFAIQEPNAFALPGGKVGLNTGLLRVAETQDQLAAVLGHEIGHVVYRHAGERVSQQQLTQVGLSLAEAYAGRNASSSQVGLLMAALGAGAQVGVLLPFSRQHESEADLYGQALMAKAGFDPEAAAQLWRNMNAASDKTGRPPALLSTHPNPEARIARLADHAPQLRPDYERARAAGKRPNCRD